MFRLAIVLFVISLITALFSFGVIASSFGEVAKILFPIFLMLAMLACIAAGVRGVLNAQLPSQTLDTGGNKLNLKRTVDEDKWNDGAGMVKEQATKLTGKATEGTR